MQPGETTETAASSDSSDAFALLDAVPAFASQPQISGRSPPANVAPVRPPARDLDEIERSAIVTAALPRLTAGESLREISPDYGIAPSTLRAWCLQFQGPEYEAALLAQVAAQLERAAGELEESQRMARVGCSMTVKGKMLLTSDGAKSSGYTLHGPAVVAAARARASIALDAGKFWQWIGERRAPNVFAERDKKAAPQRKASFTFIVDGRKATVQGRVIEADPARLPPVGAVEPEPEEAEA